MSDYTLILASLTALAVVAVVAWLWPSALPASPQAGERGRRRQEALAKHDWFRLLEPLIRAVGDRMATVSLGGMKARMEKRLRESGRPFGLDADDLLSTSILAACCSAFLGGIACSLLEREPGAGAVIGFVTGIVFPWFKVDDAARRRRIAVCRGLPQAIDLVALSMEAGLDFPGALTQVAGQLDVDNPLRFEFEHLLHKLSIGWSRQAALGELAVRIPAPQVRQFVSSVTQAEKRGTPLARVLSTQAEVMRTKRSQAAEQAAARAAVLIIGPLMLIFTCVFVILLGPFVIQFIRGEVF
ncbi:MAG: type II secretion system F family protein [Deltaproteobacteria bacterium]|nr:type II secretion system F family protein [Deltaproteobacteria bacterium]